MFAAQVPVVAAAAVPAEAVLLGIREPEEWVAGHAPGALHIPMSELLARLEEVPRDREVDVICRSGNRSTQVTAYLIHAGWAARNVAGGLLDWLAAGRPLVSETGTAPVVA